MTEDATIDYETAANPFAPDAAPVVARPSGAMVAVAQQREVAEVQAALMIARMNPRDERACMDRILQACTRPTLADAALYSYNRGGSDVTGPSIRLAEALAQNWGNVDFGIRELEQRSGESTVEAYAWDVQTNTRQRKVFQVPHVRYTRSKGNSPLSDPRDIYEMVANQGARRLRACILGVIPGDVIEAAVRQCETTLKTKAEVTPDRLKSLVEKFGEFHVTQAQIEKRIGRHLDAMTPALMVQLGKIYNSLKDGMSSAQDWFEVVPGENGAAANGEQTKAGNEGVKEALRKAKPAKEPESAQGPTVIDAIAALDSFTDPDAMADYANGLSDDCRSDERFTKAFRKRLDAIKEKAA